MFSIRLSWPNLGVFMTWPRCVIINLILCLFLVRFPSDEMTDSNLSVQKVNWDVFRKFNLLTFLFSKNSYICLVLVSAD